MLVKLDTGFNIEVDFEITPFHKRLLAWLIDGVVMVAYGWIGNLLMGFLFGSAWASHTWAVVLFSLPVILYHLILEVTLNGQSIGKKVMSIQVISADGGQPSLSQYLIRWCFRVVDFPVWIPGAVAANSLPWWCTVFLFSGIGCVLFSDKSQRIGDLVAGTIIISTQSKTSWQDTVFMEVETGYLPRFPQVMRLSDKDINTLKSIIDNIRNKNDHDLARRISDRIQSKLSLSTEMDSFEFLQTLLKDYNYYATR